MEANYNLVVVFAIHQHESATCAHVSPYPEIPSYHPPNPISLGCPRALALCALLHASNLHWSSSLHMVIYMFQCYSLKSSHPPSPLPHSPKFCSLHLSLFTVLHIGSLLPSFRIPYMSICSIGVSLSDLLHSV